MEIKEPFIFGGATSGCWFTNREQDAARLVENFTHGINTIIISPRRWGKTSLVLKVKQQAKSKKIHIVHFDIFSCRTEEDFYRIFATEIIKQTSNKWEEWSENARHFLSALKPTVSIGVDPNTDFNISFSLQNKQLNEAVLSLPQRIAAKKGIRIVVCIDEFQQISEFADSKTFQKKLRSTWQHQMGTVSYCLYGSKKHLMTELFSRQSMPFYKFGDMFFLQKISTAHWVAYIRQRFEQSGKSISAELAERICTTVDNHSSYVQQLAWLVWMRTEKKVTTLAFETALRDLISQNSILYFGYAEGLSALQVNFLRAVANGVHNEFSHKETIAKYNMGNSANIVRVKKSLEKKELIDVYPKNITFNDPVFGLWFKENFKM
ncbi:ATPase [Bacteroidia bacterium]|nr:ATPase [Bacteroidia bacterium]